MTDWDPALAGATREAASMNEILDGIWRWTWFSEEKGMNFNGYAVKLPDGLVLVDPAYADESVWREIEKLDKPSLVLLTNKDHERASDELRRRWNVPVAIHEAEAPLLAVKPERTFGDGDVAAGALRAIRFRRLKSPGECAFFWKDRRLLFVGDAVTGHPAGRLGLVKKHLDQSAAVLDDLKILLEFDFDAILMGDGEPMLQKAKAALRDFCRIRPAP